MHVVSIVLTSIIKVAAILNQNDPKINRVLDRWIQILLLGYQASLTPESFINIIHILWYVLSFNFYFFLYQTIRMKRNLKISRYYQVTV